MEAQELLKAFMRQAAQQVYAVTAEHEGEFAAFTASSVTSLSLNPPLMMVSVDKGSRSHGPLVRAKGFVVHLLSEEEQKIAEVMASRLPPKEKLEAVGYEQSPYGPVIRGAKSYLLLEKYAVYEAGDHDIVIGKIVGGKIGEVTRPLLYHSRAYTGIRA
ncbi:MAG: flavin reductase family protein [Acidilobaceae archaeon]|nr:flavin reductase family protein [Acidilobaceae archaeon]